jgi:Fur family peroxide stress response transcriptional regulator
MKKQRKTPQKMEIKRFLTGNTCHPSAYDIYSSVKKRMPTISFATVYNNLENMVNGKELLELYDGEKKRFDPDFSPHDHFICMKCREIYDIPKIISSSVKYKNFKITSSMTYLNGVCEKCLKKEGGSNE